MNKLFRRNRNKRRLRYKLSLRLLKPLRLGQKVYAPRLSIYRSNVHIYAQIIDDVAGKTLVSASSVVLKMKNGGNKDAAFQVGKKLAEVALKAGVDRVVFDRGWYPYHGRVEALANGAREGGLKF